MTVAHVHPFVPYSPLIVPSDSRRRGRADHLPLSAHGVNRSLVAPSLMEHCGSMLVAPAVWHSPKSVDI